MFKYSTNLFFQTKVAHSILISLIPILTTGHSVTILCSYGQQRFDCQVAFWKLVEKFRGQLRIQSVDESQVFKKFYYGVNFI